MNKFKVWDTKHGLWLGDFLISDEGEFFEFDHKSYGIVKKVDPDRYKIVHHVIGEPPNDWWEGDVFKDFLHRIWRIVWNDLFLCWTAKRNSGEEFDLFGFFSGHLKKDVKKLGSVYEKPKL